MGNLDHLWWTDAAEADDVWRCRKHPHWLQALQGVCPSCLRHRLQLLCPDCAAVKPCPCSSAGPSSSMPSTSYSSSLSILMSLDRVASSRSAREHPSTASSVGAVGRVGSLIESEPAFRRSRSSALGLLRYRSGGEPPVVGSNGDSKGWRLPSWLSIKQPNSKVKTGTAAGEDGATGNDIYMDDDEKAMLSTAKLYRSRSVGIGAFGSQKHLPQQLHRRPRVCSVPHPVVRQLSTSTRGVGAVNGEVKRKGWPRWYFPSPLKAFGQRSSRSGSAFEQHRSPICRG